MDNTPKTSTPNGPRITLQSGVTTDWQDVPAEVATVHQAQVIARMPGILSRLSISAGDFVRRGEVIGRIADSSGAGGSAQAESASANAGLAQSELSRVRYLYQNGVYAKARLDQAEASARVASAQVGAAQASETVVAPSSGQVLSADVPMGSAVAPGMVLAVITAGPMVVRLDMPETLASRVKLGAQVMIQGIRINGSLTNAMSMGTVRKLYPDVQSGRLQADVSVPGLDGHYIGRHLSARVAAGTRRVLLVPAAYVTTRYGVDYVTALARDGSASDVPVETTSAGSGQIEILSGVGPGDTLIATSAGSKRP